MKAMRDNDKQTGTSRVHAPKAKDASGAVPVRHERASTARAIDHAVDGGPPIPKELTGRASTTDESLTELFRNRSAEHLADGFSGGSGDDPDTDLALDDEGTVLQPDADDDLDTLEESEGADSKG